MTDQEGRRTEVWTEPGTYEVAPGVYRIPLPLPNDGLRAVNVYAITSGNSLILVDSGWALTEARSALEVALRPLGAELGDVDQFLITHLHRDHYSQAVALRRDFGRHVLIGRGEEPGLVALTSPNYSDSALQFALLHAHGADVVVDRLRLAMGSDEEWLVWELPDAWLDDQQTIDLPSRTLTVMHTPGHTRGHVVYLDARHGLLFAGDHVLPHITPSIGFEPLPDEHPLAHYLQALRRVRLMPDTLLLPAHGPVSPSVHHRVDEILAHHDTRLSIVADAVSGGATTALAVALRMTWTRREVSFAKLDAFNQMLAVLEIAAHLDLLTVQGRLHSRRADGVHYFEPADDRRTA